MSNAKVELKSLLKELPDDCSLEDIQYHLYVVEKVKRGIERAGVEGTLCHEDAQAKLDKWISK
jgi:hypothetical protein